jgi:hypothetical protein
MEAKGSPKAWSISRTSSGLAIRESPSPELNVEAVLSLVDRIAASGYLKVKEEGSSTTS